MLLKWIFLIGIPLIPLVLHIMANELPDRPGLIIGMYTGRNTNRNGPFNGAALQTCLFRFPKAPGFIAFSAFKD
jgi:hypothetical protein